MLRINEIIKEKRLTVSDVAEKLGITRGTAQRQIHGNPSLETLQRYAEVLEVDITELFRSKKEEVVKSPFCPHCGKSLKIEIEKAD